MLLKVSKWFIYISLLSILVVMTSTFFPFIGGKDYFFRFSVELALIFFVLWWAFEAGADEASVRWSQIVRSPLFIAVSVFVFIMFLSTIFAYDPHAAFWSNFERGEGFFQMLHYYVFFALSVFLFKTKEDWRKLFRFSLVAAALMILYGVFAQTGWVSGFISPWQGNPNPPTGFKERMLLTRFDGSLGNPAYVAPYLLFSIFYAVYLWGEKVSRKALANLGYGFLILIFMFFFMLSQTRGGLLGLGAGIILFLAYLLFVLPKAKKRPLALVLLIFLLLGGSLINYRRSNFVKQLPGGRIFDIALSDQTVNTRLWTWGSALKGFKERPLLGWGLENFTAVFDKYFDPRHAVPGVETETWFDRAHGIYFDYLAETGILGLLGYLSIFAVFYRQFFRTGQRNNEGSIQRSAGLEAPSSFSHAQKAAIFALPAAYLIQGVAIFDVLPIYINLFILLAFGCYYFGSQFEKNRHIPVRQES